jgi:hypothetical protein
MQVEERVAKAPEAFEPSEDAHRWTPYIVHGPEDSDRRPVHVREGDRYLSVDDVADGLVVMEVSSWPLLDREGRLWWEDDPYEFVTSLPRMQAVVDGARRAAGIIAPDRPIRVGDAFLARGLTRRHRYLTRVQLVDVSAAAREAAKMALYGAVASTLDRDQAWRMTVTQQYQEPAPDVGIFDVRQDTAAQVNRGSAP